MVTTRPVPPSQRTSHRFAAHEKRISALETAVRQNTGATRGLSSKVDDCVTQVSQMNSTLASLLPQVMSSMSDSRALKVVKRGGLCGVLLTAGGFLESYGPDIARVVSSWLAGH